MKNPFGKLRASKLSTKIILLVEIIAILSAGVFCVVSIANSRIGIKKSIQQRMLDIANCAAGFIDGDILGALKAEDAGSQEYRQIYNALNVFRNNAELEYVYGVRDEGNGKFTFTVDTDPVDPGEFGEEVKYTEALAIASKGTAAVDETPYTDAWGTFYSAYSPVFDSSGKVAGIIVADFPSQWFEAQLSERTGSTILNSCAILLTTMLIAAVMSLIVARPFILRQEQLTQEVEKKASENKQLSLQVVRSLVDAIDAKDVYTKNHASRVSQYAVKIAEAIGWKEDRINDLRYAALLHDIGKIGVPDSILSNPNPLSDVEYDIIKSHTTIGGDILKSKSIIKAAEVVARSHHERYDGKGYPQGLKGEEISEEARIVTIADAFDSMNSHRAYRRACDPAYIRKELIDGRGTQFDPHFVDVFIGLWDKGLLGNIIRKDAREDTGDLEASSALLHEIMEKFVTQSAADDYDAITGVMNRSIGEAAIAQAMKGSGGCLAFLDLDNLKKINDTYGHKAGDHALRFLGDALTLNSQNCICCRLGGDEFLFFMKNFTQDAAESRIKKIIADFEQKKSADVETALATISAGLAMCSHEDTYMKSYGRADRALYYVKQHGKNGYQFYTPESEAFHSELGDVNRIVTSIRTSGSYRGAMDVEYREFATLYEFIENIKKRFSQPFKLIMITLETDEREPPLPEELEKAMYFMEQSIQQTIRNVDVLTRYSRQQFLIILLGSGAEGVQIAVDRIFRGYYKMCGSGAFPPSYAVAEVDA